MNSADSHRKTGNIQIQKYNFEALDLSKEKSILSGGVMSQNRNRVKDSEMQTSLNNSQETFYSKGSKNVNTTQYISTVRQLETENTGPAPNPFQATFPLTPPALTEQNEIAI